jgi:L-fuculose-phosphate aldolase
VSEGTAAARPRRAPITLFPSGAAAAMDIVRVCRRLYERGLIAGQDGNVSVRLGEDRVLVTPAGASKGELRADELVEVDLDGALRRPGRAASSEVRMHLRIYRDRPDVGAVVHAHPPTATGFGVAGEDLMAPVLPELVVLLGGVPLVPFAAPGGDALAEAVAAYTDRHDAVLLANHGATTLGPTLAVAHQRMESLEHAACILLTARLLGRVTELTPDQVRALAGGPSRPAGARPASPPRIVS